MPVGPGRYDKWCTKIREEEKAEGVILIVVGGVKGEGFSAQLPPHLTAKMPEVLRHVARQIEESF